MHYKFNPFSGRLSAPSPLEIPSKYGKGADGPSMQFIENTKIAVTDPPTYNRGRFGRVPHKLQTKMRQFQIPNGLPVHIKGGPFDKILYGLTSAVCLVGLIDCFRVYYTLSYPTPPSE